MAKKITLQHTATTSTGIGQALQRYGIRLSDVEYVAPSKLSVNPLNAGLFKRESEQYFERLRSDIKEKGILNPLLATSDGRLLAGHNRLSVAQELGIASVPVQFVEEALSAEREKEIVVKDNLLRRQFTAAEWIAVYKQLYPNFDEEILREKRGGDRKSTGKNASEKIKTALGGFDSEGAELTAKKIAADTKQSVNAVQKQLANYKKRLAAKTDQSRRKEVKSKNPPPQKNVTPSLAARQIETLLAANDIAPNLRKQIRLIIRSISALE